MILTLLPDSWSTRKIAIMFNSLNYQIRQAKKAHNAKEDFIYFRSKARKKTYP